MLFFYSRFLLEIMKIHFELLKFHLAWTIIKKAASEKRERESKRAWDLYSSFWISLRTDSLRKVWFSCFWIDFPCQNWNPPRLYRRLTFQNQILNKATKFNAAAAVPAANGKVLNTIWSQCVLFYYNEINSMPHINMYEANKFICFSQLFDKV